jgi:hypothetical protein
MNRLTQARTALSQVLRLIERQGPKLGLEIVAELADKLDEAIAHIDLEQEAREQHARGERVEDASRPEWRDGWPRGTWVASFGFVFEVVRTARDFDGSLMYLIPASYLGVSDQAPGRYVAAYAASVSEARLSDGSVYYRTI